MSTKDCKKQRHSKNRDIAEAHTRKRKQVRLYRTAIKQPHNLSVMDAFIQSVHPEGVINWLRRVHP